MLLTLWGASNLDPYSCYLKFKFIVHRNESEYRNACHNIVLSQSVEKNRMYIYVTSGYNNVDFIV